MNSIEKEFSDTFSILTDFRQVEKVVVAFSGGVDSLALLSLCKQTLGSERVCAVYVNHCIRSSEELDCEIKLNVENCRMLGIELKVVTLDKQELVNLESEVGTEAAARILRYRILNEEKCDFILTAHHYDDQIETLLMRVMSGSPVTGLRGIFPVSGRIIRPLLEFRKKELEQYVKELGLSWSTDSTNSDNSIRRNEIRNIIIPELRTVMPDFEKHLFRLQSYAIKECNGNFNYVDRVGLAVFNGLNKAQRYMVLYSMWDSLFDSKLPQTLIERVIKSAEAGLTVTEGANGGLFCITSEMIYLVNPAENEQYNLFEKKIDSYCLQMPSCKISLLNNDYLVITGVRDEKIDSKTLFFDSSKLEGTLKVRFPRPGDLIFLKEGKKTVKKLLKDMKTPSALRDRVPVLEDETGICAVFASVIGGNDRICAKLRSCLAPDNKYMYIYTN